MFVFIGWLLLLSGGGLAVSLFDDMTWPQRIKDGLLAAIFLTAGWILFHQ